jgi:hypothetical protein
MAGVKLAAVQAAYTLVNQEIPADFPHRERIRRPEQDEWVEPGDSVTTCRRDQVEPAAPPMPASRARMMAPDRSLTCSLVMMLET